MMKRKVIPSELQPLGGVYRVPLKRVYKSKRINECASWDDVYAHVRCIACKKHFKEGEAYQVITEWKKHANGSASPSHKYQHINCT